MPENSLRILFAGSGEFGLPSLHALQQRHQLVRIYTQPDRPAGRGRRLNPTPVAAMTQKASREASPPAFEVIKTADLSSETLPCADVLVVIAFGQRISQRAAVHPRLGSINLHASLLPKYRGAAPIHHALLNRETVTGNSVIRLAKKMDAGAILGQSQVEIHEAETAGELHDRLALDGAALVLRVLDELAAGTAVERKQNDALATHAPKLSRADAVLDFTGSAAEVAAKINGLSPWPGCHVRLMEGGQELDRLTLLRARVAPLDRCPVESPAESGKSLANASPGALVDPWPHSSAGRNAILSANAGSEYVEILKVQPQGRRAMPLSAYANGHPWRAGMRLQSV